MSDTRYWTVEVDGPEGSVEMTGEAAANVRKADAVAHLVEEYANELGVAPRKIRVTNAWSVLEGT